MRQSARWMVLLDDRIMEYTDENGPSLPSEIADDDRIPYGKQHVGNRCRKLTEKGFLENVGNGVYVLTTQGKDYLEGSFDANEEVPDAPNNASEEANGA
jgi:predicted transcriptional regulator